VVLEEGSPMSVEDLKCLCARELQPQMVPSRIAVMSDLPLGAAGKTLMRASPDSDL
jgi:acyl-CoA synthetase (AMP-forming)/AMP-acid ligase II